jgi:hypothetical protein
LFTRGAGSEVWVPFAVTSISGLSLSTLITLIMMPTLYSIFEGVKIPTRDEGRAMKAVLIVHNVAIDNDVNDALESAGIRYYTKFTDTLGRGEMSEPHLNTEVWPGVNTGTFVVTDPAKAKALMDSVRKLREKLASEGVKAFMWEIDDIT